MFYGCMYCYLCDDMKNVLELFWCGFFFVVYEVDVDSDLVLEVWFDELVFVLMMGVLEILFEDVCELCYYFFDVVVVQVWFVVQMVLN